MAARSNGKSIKLNYNDKAKNPIRIIKYFV